MESSIGEKLFDFKVAEQLVVHNREFLSEFFGRYPEQSIFGNYFGVKV